MDLNKSVPPWRRKSWRKGYSHTMRMQNQAKLAAGVHRGHESRNYPAPEGLRRGQTSSLFMYVGARDPSFSPYHPPPSRFAQRFTCCCVFVCFYHQCRIFLFALTTMRQALVCDQFEWADCQFFFDFSYRKFPNNSFFFFGHVRFSIRSVPIFEILAAKQTPSVPVFHALVRDRDGG